MRRLVRTFGQGADHGMFETGEGLSFVISGEDRRKICSQHSIDLGLRELRENFHGQKYAGWSVVIVARPSV